jgi:flagellar biosynthetic protein FlhB
VAEQDDRDQRTEQPTPKRLQDARGRGQVPRSRELAGTAVMVAGAGTLLLAGHWLAGGMVRVMHGGLGFPRSWLDDPQSMTNAFAEVLLQAGIALAPLFGVAFVVAALAPASIGGWVMSGEALGPDLNRMNPVAGLRRIFGVQGLVELGKALAKFAVVGTVAVAVMWWLLGDMMALGGMPSGTAIARAGWLLAIATLLMSVALVLIAAVDVPFQVWSHRRNLRMTRQEIREEFKETEGRPEVKSRIRNAQREMARRRMMQEVPRADVVLTNPTHYSVALRYEAGRMRAPRVVAKGRDLVALEIRRVAREHGVTVFEAPPLTRAVYATTELNREIPAGLYLAVAQVLSYVYQLRAAGSDGWKLRPPEPQVSGEFLVP